MNHTNPLFPPTVDLTNCDKEPIHIPGLIQAHGILFVLQEPQLKILQVSKNTLNILGISPQKILNKKLNKILESRFIEQIHKQRTEGLETINPLKLSIKTPKEKLFFDGILHRSDGVLILGLEPVTSKDFSDFFSLYHLVQAPLTQIQKTLTFNEVCQAIVKEIRKLTGFDRVMVYQFDAEDAGTVIAEDKLEGLNPYLGLHYPASDIPRQARHLYKLNLLRLIPDVNYQAVELFPVNNPLTNQPLDLSFSVLRSVSPIHIEYLKNMGVGASMSISLIRNQKLWGLIACHHQSPKYVPYEIRTACELLGKMMALELTSKEENQTLDYRIKLNSIRAKFIEAISEKEDFVEGLLKEKSNLLELVSAQGAAICANENLTLIGQTPESVEIQGLIQELIIPLNQDIVHTDSLSKLYPKAEKFKDIGSGLLALSLSHIHKQYVLWFRPEVIQTVNWAGNPNKPVEIKQNGEVRLTPRKSFDLWQETVRLKSLPWQPCEIEIALELRSAIVGIVLQKADQIAKINQQLTLALSVAQMGIWDWDLLTNQIIWSRGHEELFGLEAGTFNGTYEAFEACVYSEDRATIALAVEQARREKQDYEHQFRVVWGDGSLHWIEAKGKFFYNAEGQAVRMLGTVVEISDRKARETQLRLLESVVLSTNDAVVITEAEPIHEPGPRIIYVNPAFTRMTGYSLEEVLGKTPRILQGENTDRTALAQLRTALETWEPVRVDLINYRKDGSPYWVEVSIVPVTDETGWYTHWVAVQRDITARKQAEATLQQLNQELELRVQQRTQALERSQAALQQQMERERLIVAVAQQIRQSLEFTEILNTSVQQVQQVLGADRVVVYRIWPDHTGTVIAEAIAPQWPKIANMTLPEEAFPQHCRETYAQGKVFTLTDRLANTALLPCMVEFLEQIQVRAELVVPILQNNHLWGLLITHQCSGPRTWQPGEIELIQQLANQMAIAIQQSELYQQLQNELRERQQVAIALQQSEAEFRSLSENSPIGIFRIDAQGQWIYSNPRCQAICGYTFDQALGDGWLNFVHPEDQEWLVEEWSQTLSEQQEFLAEVRYVHPDGIIRFAQMRTSPLCWTSSQFMGYVGTVEDVTERRAIEQMKSEFISIVSHELRTPLSSIRGSLGLLAAGVFKNKPDAAQQMLDIATHDTERLVRLVNDILDLERLEAQKVKLNQQWCEGITLMEQSVKTLQSLAAQSHITLLVEPTSVQVWADSLSEDVSSSSKPEEKAEVIETRFNSEAITPTDNRQAQAEVMAAVQQVWDKFKAGFESRIGLFEEAIAQLWIGSLDQELRASVQGEAHRLIGSLGSFGLPKGSEVARQIEQLLRLEPLGQNQVSQLEEWVLNLKQIVESKPSSVAIASDFKMGLGRLLVVDGDTILTQQVKQEALIWGFQVEVATDLTTARQSIASHPPDVILLDLTFSDTSENGITLLAELAQRHPKIPVLVLTAQNQLGDRVEVAHLGGSAFLEKPINPEEILKAVSYELNRTQKPEAKILIVDDDHHILATLSALLTPWGFQVETLTDPQQFGQTLTLSIPDLLILDIEMPGFSGIELCQVVRGEPRWRELPVLFLSAHHDPNIIHQVFAVGADDYVQKPIIGPELIARILNRLERTRILKRFAEVDELTGTATRHKSILDLEQLLHLAERQNQPLCLMILDLDHFKRVNDRYGHQTGDKVLYRLGRHLKQFFRSEDIVARWGGEEFVLGLYGMTREQGAKRLNEFLNVWRQQKFTGANHQIFQVTFSAGVAEYSQDGIKLQELYSAADAALYQAKARGRNQVLLSTPTIVQNF